MRGLRPLGHLGRIVKYEFKILKQDSTLARINAELNKTLQEYDDSLSVDFSFIEFGTITVTTNETLSSIQLGSLKTKIMTGLREAGMSNFILRYKE